MNQGNVSVVAAAQSCSSLLPSRGRMARLSRPSATACKFPAHRNYAVTRVSATGFVLGTVWLATNPERYHWATAPRCVIIIVKITLGCVTACLDFIDWLWTMSVSNLTPGANYQRFDTCLGLVRLILDSLERRPHQQCQRKGLIPGRFT